MDNGSWVSATISRQVEFQHQATNKSIMSVKLYRVEQLKKRKNLVDRKLYLQR